MQANAQQSATPMTPASFGTAARAATLLRKVLLLAMVGLLGWGVTLVNVSDYFAREGTAEGTRQALTWYGKHPEALIDTALKQPAGDSAGGLALLQEAAAAQPAEGRLYAALAQLADTGQAPQLALVAMQKASELAPQRTDVQLAAWQFWLRRSDPVKALHAANVILNRNPEMSQALYPQFLKLMAHPRSNEAFADLLKSPIRWWPDFFQFVSNQAPNVDVLRALYAMQAQGPNPTDDIQLRAYLTRLQHDGYWVDSYLAWLNALPRESLDFSSELYNGGFEDNSRNLGFDWIDQPMAGALVGFDPTYGTSGARALHVVFQGLRTQWRHFNQYLMLPPGEYSLRGRVRIDGLQTERGVQWRVACLDKKDALATTDRYKGTDEWRHFVVSLSVPATGCAVQDLRLEVVGKAALDFVADGQIWFDDLAIVRR